MRQTVLFPRLVLASGVLVGEDRSVVYDLLPLARRLQGGCCGSIGEGEDGPFPLVLFASKFQQHQQRDVVGEFCVDDSAGARSRGEFQRGDGIGM